MPARVLIVDDNQANLDLADYLLCHAGYTTLLASDGEMGVATARREAPDLIVCDLQMPLMDGFEVLRQLRLDFSSVAMPIVAVTALSMPGDRQKVLAAGFDSYISKPIDPETFVSLLEPFLRLEQRAPKIAPAT